MALILHWPLNETSGIVADETELGNDGTFYPTSSPHYSWESHDGYQALKGDGALGYLGNYPCALMMPGYTCSACVLAPDQVAVDFPLTITFWFNADSAIGAPLIEVGTALESGGDFAYARQLNVFILTTDALAFDIKDAVGSLSRVESATGVADGEWHFGAVQACPASGSFWKQKIWVDKTLVENDMEQEGAPTSINNLYWKLAGGRTVAATNPNTAPTVYNGWMTDVRVFNTCLPNSVIDNMVDDGPNAPLRETSLSSRLYVFSGGLA